MITRKGWKNIMKVKHIDDIEGFFKTVDECTDKVELIGEDIRLNLKSKLAQYFSLANIFSGGNEIPELEIICYNQADALKMVDFMIRGK